MISIYLLLDCYYHFGSKLFISLQVCMSLEIYVTCVYCIIERQMSLLPRYYWWSP